MRCTLVKMTGREMMILKVRKLFSPCCFNISMVTVSWVSTMFGPARFVTIMLRSMNRPSEIIRHVIRSMRNAMMRFVEAICYFPPVYWNLFIS